jgi:hypothetical protein
MFVSQVARLAIVKLMNMDRLPENFAMVISIMMIKIRSQFISRSKSLNYQILLRSNLMKFQLYLLDGINFGRSRSAKIGQHYYAVL